MKISVTVEAMQLESVRELLKAFTASNDLENYIKRGRSLAQVLVIVEGYEENFDFGIEFKKFLDSFGLSLSDVVFTGGDPVAETVIYNEVSVHIDCDSGVVTRLNRAYPGVAFLANHQ